VTAPRPRGLPPPRSAERHEPGSVVPPLDNAVWHSIVGPRAPLAERTRRAARFWPAVSPFGAVDDAAAPGAWRELADLLPLGEAVVVFRPVVDPPPGWQVAHRLAGVQMVAGAPASLDDDHGDVVALGAADAAEMLDLTRATRPGPFGPRTVEFGGYLGIRRDGRLVAMAGERLRTAGYTEISAVCTDEQHRGRGLATRLVTTLLDQIRARGEQPFLHAAATNHPAIRLYETLGFTVRCAVDAAVLIPPATG
jgi:ribosomal protein S18 acetylase RimI-like enzyme